MTVTTALCTSTADDVLLRGRSLPREILGRFSFTEVIYFHLTGSMPTAAQVTMLDAALVTLMEHGLTPTAITARLTYGSAPEALQGAVAAGLLSVGSTFVGSTEGNAALLTRILTDVDPVGRAREIAAEARASGRRLPGFGHPVHRPVDPRTVALLDLARQNGTFGPACQALAALSSEVDALAGRPIPVNATGAVAAILLDTGIPAEILRGIAVIARAAGLVGHIREEQLTPAMTQLWEGAESAVPYRSNDQENP